MEVTDSDDPPRWMIGRYLHIQFQSTECAGPNPAAARVSVGMEGRWSQAQAVIEFWGHAGSLVEIQAKGRFRVAASSDRGAVGRCCPPDPVNLF